MVNEFQREAAYAAALELVAVGEERDWTAGHLIDAFGLEGVALRDTLNDALRDALKQGVAREDVDSSWFARA